ncbi:4-amino-4-deoxychorismate lyase [Arthrobacter sp. MYb211]|uniref:aminodeoxychorismate lyase n=1 Tax=Micrococcaceae TaxID=1268 RepID=UPI000CFDDA3A|nr:MULTISPECIES: aminodeoxychorismate lyase [unclassified Arthrobacter]PQZ99618.1 4-amino-4-deoxychorismate lyase [Arthrobacter sp. MYb224]PRA05915.1 4-amino-4-deoxychorismate lyase [Arthrobacter sp. MYb229]PRA11311.1 4-amino-4-deoxychorismate lyase [Arthrobacter sp. MYb221]PRB52816.1 4-amino-4-deoxychorismate lyase [Arthrobacter sp. MYb216]PRC07514.1 4-amino-4-deoxychorismate lyase [Arthrobacter sp. MYb211]
MSSLVFLDPAYPAGRLADINAPQLPVTAQGVTRGDGVFESMLYTNQAVRKMEAHLARLAISAEACDLVIPDEHRWRAAIDTAVADFDADGGAEEAVVKLVVSRADSDAEQALCWVTVAPAPQLGKDQRETGIDVLLLDRGYDSKLAERAPWLLMGAKTLSYAVNMAALRFAHKHGAQDVIFTSSDGVVLEGPTSTVLIAQRDGDTKRLITPMLETGILPGTTQSAIFDAAEQYGWELGYGPLRPEDLYQADGVWLVSSVRLLTAVHTLDAKPLRLDAELHAELSELSASVR